MIRSILSSIFRNSSVAKSSESISEAPKSLTHLQRITKVVYEACLNRVIEQQYYSPSNKSYCDKSYIKALQSKNEKNNLVKTQEDNHKSSREVRKAL